MVTMMRRRGRRRAVQRPLALSEAALEYAERGWSVCPGASLSRGVDALGMPEPGRACSCDRIGCPAPGAHPVSPTWQMQATVDKEIIGQWWEARPEANVILATGRVFDILDVPAVAGATALAAMAEAGVESGPVAVQSSSAGTGARAPRGTGRMHFYVMTRGAPADEDEWWSCGLDASPDFSKQAGALRWHCRDSYVLAPPSVCGAGQDVRWVRPPAARPLPDGLRLLEYLVDACEEEG